MDDGGLRSLPAGDILESFDSHPPLILPSNTFHLELGKAIVEPALFEQLGHLQEFIRRLPRSETQAEPDVEEQVTSSLTPELSSLTRTSGSQEMRHLDVSTCVIDWLYIPQTQALEGTTTDSQSATSPSFRVFQDAAHQVVSDPVTCPSPEADLDCTSPAEPAQARGAHGDLSSCEAVLTQKLKSLELQNTLPGQADLVYHKSLALDPSCLLTPPNTPQGMELAELEADLQEGARQQKKGNWTLHTIQITYRTFILIKEQNKQYKHMQTSINHHSQPGPIRTELDNMLWRSHIGDKERLYLKGQNRKVIYIKI